MKKSFVYFFVFCNFVFILGSCQANKQAKLQESIDSFFVALRREDNNRALSYVDPEKQKEFFTNLEKVKDYRISQLQVDTVFPDEKMESALVSVNLEFFQESASELRSAKRYYEWVYLKENNYWAVNEVHPFGKGSPQSDKP